VSTTEELLGRKSSGSDSGVHPASNRNKYQKHKNNHIFLGIKVQPVRKADNLTAIYEPIV
jgi:hypothetical protein